MNAAVKAFREEYVTMGLIDNYMFDDAGGRLLRYDINWASYENTAYRDIHKWARQYRTSYGLYKYIRNIYNPSYRLGEFYRMMVWGGNLSPSAGKEGAIPIVVGKRADEARLREALVYLWHQSNWSIRKGIIPLQGSVLGDYIIKIVDDPEHGYTCMDVVHPATLSQVTVDGRGYVKAYEISEMRDYEGKDVEYRETAERVGDSVVYTTYLNNKPFPWNGAASTWSENYGFIPLVLGQHNNVGKDWGWSEMHADRSKLHELDDMASKLHDHIRRMTDPAWIANFPKSSTEVTMKSAKATPDRPQPGREEMPIMYVANENAKLQPMVVPELSIHEVGEEIAMQLRELERDYPELQMDIWSVGGDTSGRALITARQRAEKKVTDRRASYDSSIVRAQQMAIAIAGEKGYEGFEGFSLLSYKEGKIDHTVAERNVFDLSPTEVADEKLKFWQAIQAATQSVPVELALKDAGWSEERIQELYGTTPEQ